MRALSTDGDVDLKAPEVELQHAQSLHQSVNGYALGNATEGEQDWLRSPVKIPIFTLIRMTTYSNPMIQNLSPNENWHTLIVIYHPYLPSLLRDIFGNPFRSVTLNPSWLTSTVLALANGIYSEKAFDRMPSSLMPFKTPVAITMAS